MKKWLLGAALLISASVYAANITLPHTFVPGTTIEAQKVNENFTTIRDTYNAHDNDTNAHNTDINDVLGVDGVISGTVLDFNLTNSPNFRAENLTLDPTCDGSSIGRLIFNTTDTLFKVCDGTSFVSVGGAGVNTLTSVLNAGNSAGTNDIDMNLQEIINHRLENLAADPAPGSAGRVFFNTTSNEIKIDTGAAIVAIGGAQGLSSVLAVSNSAGANNIDFNNNEALNMKIENLGADPAFGNAGRIIYNTVSETLKLDTGTAITEIGDNNDLSQVLLLGNSAGATDIDFNLNEALRVVIENLVVDASPTTVGRMWFNTTAGVFRYGNGVILKELVSLDDTQTLTNKTFDASLNTLTNVPDSALSSNVVLLTGSQTITGEKTFPGVGGDAPTMSHIKGGGANTHGHVVPSIADDTFVLLNASQTISAKTFTGLTSTSNVNMTFNELREFRIENVLGLPSPGNAGRLVFNTGDFVISYDTGFQWFPLATAGQTTWAAVLGQGSSAGLVNPDVNLNQMIDMRLENVADFDGTVVTISNVQTGITTDAADVDTGFTVAVIQQGGAGKEITDVTTVADVAGSLGGTHFTINSAADTTAYYVWYDVDNLSVDPAPGGLTAIEVDISANDPAATVARNTRVAIDAIIDFDATDRGFGNPGRLAYNSTSGTVHFDDGSGWILLGAVGWDDVLLIDNSAGATNPDFNNNQALNMRLENLAGDPAAAQAGRVFFNTTSGRAKYDDGAAIHEFADLDSTQTLTSKTLATGSNTISCTASQAAIYTAGNALSCEAQLAPVRGGTGIDTSGATGVPYVTAGTWATESQLAVSRGGTGQDLSGSTGVLRVDAGVVSAGDADLANDVTGVLPIANGGTNSSTALTGRQVIISNDGGTAYEEGGAMANGTIMIGSGTGVPAPANITGDPDQVIVTNGANTIALSTPQDINTNSEVTFLRVNVSEWVDIGQYIAFAKEDINGTATQNPLNNSNTFIRLSSGGTPVTTIDGIEGLPDVDGEFVIIYNETGANVTINHDNATNTEDGILLPGGTALTLGDDETVQFIYDTDQNKWVLAGGAGAGGAGSAVLSSSRRDENGTAVVTSLVTTTSYVKLTSGGTPVTGIEGADVGVDGQRLIISNDTGSAVTIFDEDVTAAATERFKLEGSTDLSIADGAAAEFVYDTGASRWVPANGTGGGGGGGSGELQYWSGEVYRTGAGASCTNRINSPNYLDQWTDYAGNDTCLFATKADSGTIGTFAAWLDASSDVWPGFHWTPENPDNVGNTYKICAHVSINHDVSGSAYALRLRETVTSTTVAEQGGIVGGGETTLCGFFTNSTAAVKNFHIQGIESAATYLYVNCANVGNEQSTCVTFTMEEVKQ